uniref:Uncharacterized protein n=1 Tax=Cyanothece sp. (strain PCC 7425 / ATCC 29141) TaxID=395961 RepID=B8HNQ3_CYAP4
MRSTTLLPKGLRDLIIALVALALAIVVWSVLIVPVAI